MAMVGVTAASEMNFRTSLNNRMYLCDSGEFELQMTMSPTLNFVPGRGFVCGLPAAGEAWATAADLPAVPGVFMG